MAAQTALPEPAANRSGANRFSASTAWNSKTNRWPKRSANCARNWPKPAASRSRPSCARARRESRRGRDPRRRTRAEQGGGFPTLPHPGHRHGSVQRFPEFQRKRRATISHLRLARKPGQRRRQLLSNHPRPGLFRPADLLGGKVHGNVYMDFAGGSGTPLDLGFRLRTGEIEIDWANRSIMAGVESPIFAPREPASLAQVEFAPLSAAGNLWLWTPQVRFEQKIRFTDQTGMRAQIGAVQTNEVQPYQQSVQRPRKPARPGLEGRFEFYHRFRGQDGPRIEIAPGFHTSITHVAGTFRSVQSVLARLVRQPGARSWNSPAHSSAGKMWRPWAVSRASPSCPTGVAIPVHSQGGWGQLTFPATARLSFHIFSGPRERPHRGPGRIRHRPQLGVRRESVLPAGAQRAARRRKFRRRAPLILIVDSG